MKHSRPRLLRAACLVLLVVTAWLPTAAQNAAAPAKTEAARQAAKLAAPRFTISFPASVQAQPVTGRVFVMIARSDKPEPRLQVGFWLQQTPFFGVDVSQLQPGQAAVVDAQALGFPLESLKDVPAGDYYVQALLNVYTEFPRADGHVIWAHMDQWDGQQFNKSPGNLYTEVHKVHLDPQAGYEVKLELTKVIPPVEVPADTQYVKRVKIQSELLSKFWGHPFYLGATVLLPRGYDEHPEQRYPVIYIQGHFGLGAPFGFGGGEAYESLPQWKREFTEQWLSDDFPRVIAVTFQHPTPYFDDSYAVNSANNGPYGDALLQEMIPYLEKHFRMIPEPWARTLTGGSTGGWESLALQVLHPDFFNGTWTFFPDPIDFQRYGLVNIYQDDNAFVAPGFDYFRPERGLMRTAEGQVIVTMRMMSQFEDALGSQGRSGQQLEAWEAVYGPVGADGYPEPLWDKRTGKIDRQVANYMRDHGYDLVHNLKTNWSKIGPQLVGKLNLYCGDMDNFYLNLAVYRLEDFLKETKDPHYEGHFEYGRPMKGHGWHPMSNAELVKMMAERMEKSKQPAASRK
jgi:hypothetical protein